MDTHAALTSHFSQAWTGNPGTPIYDALTHERGVSPAGQPDTRARGPFEPARQVLLQGADEARDVLDGDVLVQGDLAPLAHDGWPRAHPYLDRLDVVGEVVAVDLGDVTDEPTAEYSRPIRPLALR
ncbi:hypothetical protein [Streptosporangium sp. NPDC048865]|uniref:hypothetical protein n=1 Tax=Streptosporangium sp. NPDC048865 TaxID=3155766 RepID=UPI0034356A03